MKLIDMLLVSGDPHGVRFAAAGAVCARAETAAAAPAPQGRLRKQLRNAHPSKTKTQMSEPLCRKAERFSLQVLYKCFEAVHAALERRHVAAIGDADVIVRAEGRAGRDGDAVLA